MIRFIDLIEQRNVVSLKDLFDEVIAEKVLRALEGKKKEVALKTIAQQINYNTLDNKSALHYDERGYIGKTSVPHTGGLSNPKLKGM
jgi:hypothetical protein